MAARCEQERQPHKDNEQRKIKPTEAPAYKERWDLLHEVANAVPMCVPGPGVGF